MRSYGEGVAAAAAYGAPAPAPASYDGAMPERLSTRPRRSPRGADDSDGDSDDDGGYARAPASRAGGGSLSSKDKKDLRRERNREHARNSRERKRQRLELLSEENDELRSHCNTVREENLKLRALLQRIVGGEDPAAAQGAGAAGARRRVRAPALAHRERLLVRRALQPGPDHGLKRRRGERRLRARACVRRDDGSGWGVGGDHKRRWPPCRRGRGDGIQPNAQGREAFFLCFRVHGYMGCAATTTAFEVQLFRDETADQAREFYKAAAPRVVWVHEFWRSLGP